MDMCAPSPVCHRIFGRRPRKYKIMQIVLNDEIMVHSTYQSRQDTLPATALHEPVRSVADIVTTTSEQRKDKKLSSMVKDLSPVDMEQNVPSIDQTQRDIPFMDFMIPINPPVRVSIVYARQTALLSERDHQMYLVKLANLGDL